MIDIRTLLFANAIVFAVLAAALLLVWRGNPRFPGLRYLARVHVSMMVGAAVIGLEPGPVPAGLSALVGNALVVLALTWLLDGIRGLYGLGRDLWPRIALPVWAVCMLSFVWILPSLRGRILTTGVFAVGFLLRAAWTARRGLQARKERGPSLLILGSLGLLGAVFALRCAYVATAPRVADSVGSDAFTLAMLCASLVAATGWTFGVMNLVYARLNDEARRSREAVEQLVQVAAHELRNPLTSIFGTLKLLSARGGDLSADDRDRLLAVARRNSERMVRLIDDLLDLERVESGRAAFDVEAVDVEHLLLHARELSEGHAHQRGVTIAIAPIPGARVRADPHRLLQVVVNLFSNAVKFSPPGETVAVSAAQVDGVIRVEVRDSGPGIPRDFRSRIFERFARGAPAAPDEQGKGSGLGLAISKAIIESMGGRIGFETSGRAGTTFYFELPALSE